MLSTNQIVCDGCGLPASEEHNARRLKRLENMTRYRPIHVQALLLGVASPKEDRAHLYSATSGFAGEGAEVLRALGIESAARGSEVTLADFQRRGCLLAHVLECADELGPGAARAEAMRKRIPAVITRIRRSFKPKRLVLFGAAISEFIPQFKAAKLEAALVLNGDKPFEWNEIGEGDLTKVLATPLQAV